MRMSSAVQVSFLLLSLPVTVAAQPPADPPPPQSPDDPRKVRVEVVGRTDGYKADESATANKVATPVRDIPQTLTVIPRALFVDQAAQSMADALRNAPGVTVGQGEGNRDQIVIRGQNTTSDFFVNGVRDDQERFRDLYNVESVEVLEGPAAVLFGRGGAGGIVNVVTRRPSRTADSNAALEAGSFSHRRATTQLTVPAGDRSVFGLSAMGERSGGFRDGLYLHRYAANPTFDLRIGTGTRLFLSGEHLRDRRLADRGIPSQNGRPAPVPREQFFGSRSQNQARSGVSSGTAALEHVFGNGILLRNSFLAGQYDKTYRNVFPSSAVSGGGTLTLGAYVQTTDRMNVFNQTDLIARVRTRGVEHVLLAGAEVGRQAQDELRLTPTAIPNVPAADAVRDADFATAPTTTRRDATGSVFAGYVQDQVQLSEHWKVTAGARVDRFSVGVNDAVGAVKRLSRADTAISPRAGLIFQPSRAVSLYSSYASTFLPSGQTLGLAANTQELEPENAKNYEAGTRLDLASGRVNVSAAVFRLDRNNVKNVDPADVSRLVLTGQQRADGVSVAAAADTGRVKIQTAYGYLDARITEPTTSGPAGRRPGLTPRHRGSVWATAPLTARWSAGGGVLWQSDAFTSFTNQVTLPAFARVDALVAYRVARWRLAVNVQNLFDAAYFPTAHNDNNISPGAPRSVQATLRVGF